MRLIGSCILLNALVLLCIYFGYDDNHVLSAIIPIMMLGLITSLLGLFLTQYKETRFSYSVIIAGSLIFIPTLIPFGWMVIRAIRKKMNKLQDNSDLMTAYGRLFVTSIPYIWMFLFFLLPFLIVFKISFAEMARTVPPYTDLISYEDGLLNISLNLENYFRLLRDTIYIDAYIQSLKIAAISTGLCILIGYPLAWAITQCKPSTRNILLLLIILPSWTSFLIRVYAWMGILSQTGLLNSFLMWLGIIENALVILNTNIAVYIGIIYSYLPFVVLPIYTSLSKVDKSLIEAALDLGCKPVATFFKIIVPLTKSGVIAGGMLVFIPAVGEYVIPELLGGSETVMIGKQLGIEFSNNRDWPAASAVASVMLLILIVPIIYFNKFQNKQMEGAE